LRTFGPGDLEERIKKLEETIKVRDSANSADTVKTDANPDSFRHGIDTAPS